jgi:tripartite-type tricarboxylate transporter receptor subunit TctC
MIRRHVSLFLIGAAAFGTGAALAQNYPSKPIRIVTSGVGSGADMASRLITQNATGALGQPIIIDNRPSGVIPGQVVSQAQPDGYTLLYEGSAFWLRPFLQKTPYDPLRDFQPIMQSLRQPALLAAHPALPVKNVKDLIALTRARPGLLNYATGSTGSLTHLAAELFQSMAGVRLTRVPYKSGAQALTDLMAGEVQVMFAVAPSLLPYVKLGKLRALGVTSAQPTELVPGVPTIAATGLPGFESVSNVGFFAPAKTPHAIVERLNQELVRALFKPEVKARFISDGVEPIGGSPEQFESVIKAEMQVMGKLIRDRGIHED